MHTNRSSRPNHRHVTSYVAPFPPTICIHNIMLYRVACNSLGQVHPPVAPADTVGTEDLAGCQDPLEAGHASGQQLSECQQHKSMSKGLLSFINNCKDSGKWKETWTGAPHIRSIGPFAVAFAVLPVVSASSCKLIACKTQ